MRDLCFIDVESTGLDSDIHEIIEIALIRTTFELEPKMRYHAFILPEHIETADPRALEINHYNEEHWEKEAISFLEASEHILPLTEECILAGHNVPFDSTFLTAAIKKLGLKPNWNYHRFDTSSLALLFLAQKKIRNVSLGNLLRTFGIQQEKKLHSAKNDIEYTLKLAQKMMECLHIVNGPPNLKAKMVAIEGIDGAGKSYLIKGLLKKFEDYGLSVESTEEPTRNSEQGERIRSHKGEMDPETQLKLFVEDRKQHRPLIEILRNTRDIVILDRYYPSSMAYQGPGISKKTNQSLSEVMSRIQSENESFAPKPDLVIILDADPVTAIQRLLQRGNGQDAFEHEKSLAEARAAFRAIKDGELLSCPVTIIDTCALSQEEVIEAAFKEIKGVYYG